MGYSTPALRFVSINYILVYHIFLFTQYKRKEPPCGDSLFQLDVIRVQ